MFYDLTGYSPSRSLVLLYILFQQRLELSLLLAVITNIDHPENRDIKKMTEVCGIIHKIADGHRISNQWRMVLKQLSETPLSFLLP